MNERATTRACFVRAAVPLVLLVSTATGLPRQPHVTEVAAAGTVTAAPTWSVRMVDDIRAGSRSSRPRFMTGMHGRLLFGARDGVHGAEPWISDGTPGGTHLLADLNPDGASNPIGYTVLNGIAYFYATPNGIFSDDRLWRTDGTSAGTIAIGAVTNVAEIRAVGGQLFLWSFDDNGDNPLWVSDGTDGGTRLLKSNVIPGDLTNVGGTLFFTDGQNSLWKTDGTRTGTARIRAWPDNQSGSIALQELTALRRRVYFRVYTDDAIGTELWRSDGTRSGTRVVKDIRPGRASSRPSNMAAFAGHLFFRATDSAHGGELWRSDGTAAGTKLFADIRHGDLGSNPRRGVRCGGLLYFTANDGIHGRELWRTDGHSHPSLVRDIASGGDSSIPRGLTCVSPGNDVHRLAFAADDGSHGSELWLTDGTSRGTHMFDIRLGGGSQPVMPRAALRGLYFSANDGTHGRELWSLTFGP